MILDYQMRLHLGRVGQDRALADGSIAPTSSAVLSVLAIVARLRRRAAVATTRRRLVRYIVLAVTVGLVCEPQPYLRHLEQDHFSGRIQVPRDVEAELRTYAIIVRAATSEHS